MINGLVAHPKPSSTRIQERPGPITGPTRRGTEFYAIQSIFLECFSSLSVSDTLKTLRVVLILIGLVLDKLPNNLEGLSHPQDPPSPTGDHPPLPSMHSPTPATHCCFARPALEALLREGVPDSNGTTSCSALARFPLELIATFYKYFGIGIYLGLFLPAFLVLEVPGHVSAHLLGIQRWLCSLRWVSIWRLPCK